MMTDHPAEGALQAYLDGEMTPEHRQGVHRHLAGCAGCRHALDALRALADRTRSALAEADVPPPAADAARWEVRREWAARRSAAHRRRVAAAASVVLLVGAGWAAAMPGSPIRGWIAGETPTETMDVAAPPETLEDGPASRTGVSVPTLEGTVFVSLEAVPAGGAIDVRLTEALDAAVSAPLGARFESGAGRLRVDAGGAEGDLTVEIPESATSAEILLDGQSIFLKSGMAISYPGPTPVPMVDGSVRFRAEASP